uniref:Speckle-type POZ protein-like (inferred by orthology to a human protein) n=1 Tax=Strongyloides venezuelensis TaxID=75913 RepID=A0A0K0FFU7_STRVS
MVFENDKLNNGSCNIQTKVTKFNYTFSIQNFSLRTEKTGKKIKSPTFVIGWKNRSEWCLWVYPNGDRKESNEYVSVFLTLLNPDKAKAKFRLSILNDKEEKKKVFNGGDTDSYLKNSGWGKSKFVRKDFLLNESNDLLINNKLKILCEIQVINCESKNNDNSELSTNITIPQSKLLLDYRNMLNLPLFTDCIIKVEDTEIKVHKAVLVARSPVFHNILNSTLEELRTTVIEIEDFRVEVVREMLKYIYTDEVSNMQNMANEMFEIANKYQLHRLKAISERHMYTSLSVENVCERFSLSEKYSIKSLKECCTELILENAGWLTKTNEWKEFVLVHPLLLESLFIKLLNIRSEGSI